MESYDAATYGERVADVERGEDHRDREIRQFTAGCQDASAAGLTLVEQHHTDRARILRILHLDGEGAHAAVDQRVFAAHVVRDRSAAIG